MSRRVVTCGLAIAICALLPGCVERRFLVESNPPGAMVYVNNVPHGPAPVDIPFTFYGTYNITLMKDGYKTKVVKQEISAPWYQYPPIDFFAESLWPMQVTDIRPLFYELEPVQQVNIDQLKADAEELRLRARALPAPKYPERADDGKNAPFGVPSRGTPEPKIASPTTGPMPSTVNPPKNGTVPKWRSLPENPPEVPQLPPPPTD